MMKSHYYGTPRQEIGRETSDGQYVGVLSDGALGVARERAFRLGLTADLRVLDLEVDRRAEEEARHNAELDEDAVISFSEYRARSTEEEGA